MAHDPLNHPLRPIYRALAALTGLYLIAFGVLGMAETSGAGLFARDAGEVLAQGTNLANSLLLAAVGVLVLVGTVIGRNIDVATYRYLGWTLLVVGMIFLAVIRTDVNYLNHTINTTIVIFIVGTILITAGLYSKVGDPAEGAESIESRQDAEPAGVRQGR